jgi:uncharacterized protein (TIGR03083 family)
MTDASTADPISVLRSSHERLRTVVAPLTPDQLRQRAYTSEWSIAQVLSHLGSGAEINALSLDAGLAGAPAPQREAFQTIWDTWNAKESDQQAADGLAADAELVSRVEALRDSPARFAIWVGEVDINGLAASRVFEHAVHTWDVAVALDPTATVAADAVPLILSGLGRLVGFVAKPAGATGRIHVGTTSPDQELVLTLGERSTLEPWDGGEATARVQLPAEAFVRLVYGRLDPGHTPAGIEAEGITLDELRAIFPGF